MDPANRWWVRPSTQQNAFEVVDAYGIVLATVFPTDSVENAAKRAALFAKAPELFDSLCDALILSGHELPEHTQAEMQCARELINSLRR